MKWMPNFGIKPENFTTILTLAKGFMPDVIFRLFSMRDLQICNTKITPIIFASVLFLLYFEF